ncbi:hypothetical protein PGB28_08025 [Primorskyibacter aestuariivivens]|uniref:hypothetical protein n=1 Tax=Primorskyibacter aestuariivivens TaxID=1888912 RepID=UPI002300FC1F|nr:hypothetical protein [Primorskyibacter aestuariivivens]MDA7428403.1 hypothetical protein [Primorskyibacter aestuariivivens]
MLLPVVSVAQSDPVTIPPEDSTPGRTGNNSLETCLRNPEGCPNFFKEDYADPNAAPTRGDDEALTPDEKLQRFIQQFECGDTDAGICVEAAE